MLETGQAVPDFLQQYVPEDADAPLKFDADSDSEDGGEEDAAGTGWGGPEDSVADAGGWGGSADAAVDVGAMAKEDPAALEGRGGAASGASVGDILW